MKNSAQSLAHSRCTTNVNFSSSRSGGEKRFRQAEECVQRPRGEVGNEDKTLHLDNISLFFHYHSL